MSPLAHASIGVFAKPAVPKASVWVLVAATQVPDVLFFAFEAAGIEHQAVTQTSFSQGITYLSPALIPWSHGLLMCAVWSVLVAAVAYLFYKDYRTSAIVGAMVFSHWLLDAIVYNNLPLFFADSPQIGLGLATSGPGFVVGVGLEAALVIGGIVYYFVARKQTVK